jgi:3-hydroxy acid dehydrogenase/malonic semialdehyde reductase
MSSKENSENADLDEWNQVLMVNLVNTMRLTQKMVYYLKQSKPDAAVITIGSIAGTMSMSNAAAYGASKHGIRGFSVNLFEDLREHGIKVSVIQPGMVNTPMVNDNDKLDQSKMIQVEDIADCVMYVLNCKSTVCPTEITLRPQRSPYKK